MEGIAFIAVMAAIAGWRRKEIDFLPQFLSISPALLHNLIWETLLEIDEERASLGEKGLMTEAEGRRAIINIGLVFLEYLGNGTLQLGPQSGTILLFTPTLTMEGLRSSSRVLILTVNKPDRMTRPRGKFYSNTPRFFIFLFP